MGDTNASRNIFLIHLGTKALAYAISSTLSMIVQWLERTTLLKLCCWEGCISCMLQSSTQSTGQQRQRGSLRAEVERQPDNMIHEAVTLCIYVPFLVLFCCT